MRKAIIRAIHLDVVSNLSAGAFIHLDVVSNLSAGAFIHLDVVSNLSAGAFIHLDVVSNLSAGAFIHLDVVSNLSAGAFIHLDVVSNLSAGAFIQCLKRFIARKGVPNLFISDNATCFKNEELKLCEELLLLNVKWQHIVEAAPNWGGFYERVVLGWFL